MAKLIDDPKVVELVSKEVARAKKATVSLVVSAIDGLAKADGVTKDSKAAFAAAKKAAKSVLETVATV